jgi:hypothetical protein
VVPRNCSTVSCVLDFTKALFEKGESQFESPPKGSKKFDFFKKAIALNVLVFYNPLISQEMLFQLQNLNFIKNQ